MLTQLFKLPGFNLLFGEETAQVVTALGLLALCLYNPAAMPATMALVVNGLKLTLMIFGTTELICKILTSLHNNHPYLLRLFAPAIVVLLSAMLYTYGIVDIHDVANQLMQAVTLKTKRLLASTMELLPTYITQPAYQAYTTMWTLLGYPTKEIELAVDCMQTTGKSVEECVEETLIPAQVGCSSPYMKTIVTSVRNHLNATRKVVNTGVTSMWNSAKTCIQRLKSFFVNEHKIAA
jgi:hypothetical protein